MGNLTRQTKAYILGTLILGTVLFAFSASQWNWRETWIQTIVLSIVGALTLLFKVEGATDRTHYDITFVIYGCSLILFGAPTTVIMIVAAHLIEWIWHRYAWYIQTFNIASYVVVAVATNIIYEIINPARIMDTWQAAVSMLAAMAIFTLLNHGMIGIIVWMARGENFSQSGIFGLFALMLDLVLLCMGAGAAVILAYNPLAVILILLPLYLIYTTLRVPALERQVETDLKTGLYNQKYFLTGLDTELRRAARFDRPVTVVMADMDLLRNINNTYGHLAGDEVLIGVAKILKELSREYDIVSRFGGEEFAILLPETTPFEVYPKIQTMRIAIEKAEFLVPTSVKPIKVTMSFGIAGRQAGLDGRGIIHNADLALYHAKLNGRNRVFIYSDEGFIDLNPSDPAAPPSISSDPVEAPPPSAVPADPPPAEPAPTSSNEPSTPSGRLAEATRSQPLNRKAAGLWVNLYIVSLALAAISLFSLTLLNVPAVDWMGILVFTLLIAATEWASIDIYIRNTAVSTSAVVLIAGILLFGPFSAIIMSITIAVMAWIKHKSPFSRFIFNMGNQLFAGITCLLLIQWIGSRFADWSMPLQVLATSLAALLVYGFTSLFISVGISMNLRKPAIQIWKERFSWLAPYYLGMGVIAYSLIFSYTRAGVIGTTVILVPLILLRVSQKQFIDRTKDTVNELKQKNKILEEHTTEIIRLNDGLLDTLAEVIDLRDPYILGHSQQVTQYSVMIAKQMGLSAERIEIIRKASLMHDLGKLGIEASILAKPSRLTETEFEDVKRHVTVGADLLRKSQALQSLIKIVLHHHEHYDGSGYPDRLKGPDIPLEARIVSLADSVEAMTSGRPYRRALDFDEVLEEVRRCSGSQFDPAVVGAFEKIVDKVRPAMVHNKTLLPIPSTQSEPSAGF